MTIGDAGRQAARTAERTTDKPWFRALARGGFAASGLIQILVGVLAIEVALGGGSGSADQSGALADLAGAPFGAVVLVLVLVTAVALGLWLIVDGIVQYGDAKQVWKERLKSWGKAVVYLAIGVTALSVLLGAAGGGSSRNRSQQAGATVLSLPGGPIILAVAGIAVIGLGAALVYKGVASTFVKTIRVPPGSAGRATVLLGRVGYAARGVAVAAVGVLLVVAAFTQDPDRSSGLDGALKAFVQLPYGPVILVLIGLGWIASGVYGFIRAKQAKLD